MFSSTVRSPYSVNRCELDLGDRILFGIADKMRGAELIGQIFLARFQIDGYDRVGRIFQQAVQQVIQGEATADEATATALDAITQ